ncbi:hypothetical protein ACFL60_02625 [Candidatus Omnitrophota bacterium]
MKKIKNTSKKIAPKKNNSSLLIFLYPDPPFKFAFLDFRKALLKTAPNTRIKVKGARILKILKLTPIRDKRVIITVITPSPIPYDRPRPSITTIFLSLSSNRKNKKPKKVEIDKANKVSGYIIPVLLFAPKYKTFLI